MIWYNSWTFISTTFFITRDAVYWTWWTLPSLTFWWATWIATTMRLSRALVLTHLHPEPSDHRDMMITMQATTHSQCTLTMDGHLGEPVMMSSLSLPLSTRSLLSWLGLWTVSCTWAFNYPFYPDIKDVNTPENNYMMAAIHFFVFCRLSGGNSIVYRNHKVCDG